MTAAIVTRDFLAWCEARGMTYSESPPVLWGLITLYDHERDEGLWPDGREVVGVPRDPASPGAQETT